MNTYYIIKTKHTYNVVVVGDEHVGKTTFITRHLTGEFTTIYTPTTDISIISIKYNTNKGIIECNVYDFSGKKKYRDLREKYYINADAILIFFDVTVKSSYVNVPSWYQEIINVNPRLFIVICGNKYDAKHHEIKSREITFHQKKSLHYYYISAKSNYHFDKPFLAIIHKFLGRDTYYIPWE